MIEWSFMRAAAIVLICAGCATPRYDPAELESPDAAPPPASAATPPAAPAQVPEPGEQMDGAVRMADGTAPTPPDGAPDAGRDGARPPAPAPDAPAVSCSANQLSCLGASNLCDRRSWDFENGQDALDGWDLAGYGGRLSTTRARSGTQALAFEVFSDAFSSTTYAFCREMGSVDIRGMTLTAWVNLEVTAGRATATECVLGGRGGGRFGPSTPVSLTPDRWTRLSIDIDPVDLQGATEIGYVYVQCQYGVGDPWAGWIHLDDVNLE